MYRQWGIVQAAGSQNKKYQSSWYFLGIESKNISWQPWKSLLMVPCWSLGQSQDNIQKTLTNESPRVIVGRNALICNSLNSPSTFQTFSFAKFIYFISWLRICFCIFNMGSSNTQQFVFVNFLFCDALFCVFLIWADVSLMRAWCELVELRSQGLNSIFTRLGL